MLWRGGQLGAAPPVCRGDPRHRRIRMRQARPGSPVPSALAGQSPRQLDGQGSDQREDPRLVNTTAYAVRERLIERWKETMRSYYRSDAKRVYYLSMEFLTGACWPIAC